MVGAPAAMRRSIGGAHDPTASLPSPTLSNVDMLLPMDSPVQISSPPRRNAEQQRPPSPSYLRGPPPGTLHAFPNNMERPAMDHIQGKNGLMSRKMLLLRGQTASRNNDAVSHSLEQATAGSVEHMEANAAVSNVGGRQSDHVDEANGSEGGDSSGSDDLDGMPQFLAKYANGDDPESDDESADGDATPRRPSSGVVKEQPDQDRMRREKEEYNSAVLSERAEAILANAKKRLTLMEGNLRGARDLVAPLTAANLKRATSLSFSNSSFNSFHSSRARLYDGYHHDQAYEQPQRGLSSRTGSPFRTPGPRRGHYRGYSDIELSERPSTALERTNGLMRSANRIPVKVNVQSWTGSLRGSRSFDSLGPHPMRLGAARETASSKHSLEMTLDPLMEDEDIIPSIRDAASSRSSSRTDNLREQMSSLKGRISSLRERAREDNMKRRNMQNSKEASPLNNAAVDAPEFFYTASQHFGSSGLDANAGVGQRSRARGLSPLLHPHTAPDIPQALPSSRNAFAEQALRRNAPSPARNSDKSSNRSPSRYPPPGDDEVADAMSNHSGSTPDCLDSEHTHDLTGSSKLPGSFDDFHDPVPDTQDSRQIYSRNQSRMSEKYTESVYEDAPARQEPVVAHEDREDAFDYEHFFLHSSMGTYNVETGSVTSDTSVSSQNTAKAPTATPLVPPHVEQFDEHHGLPLPPETPEKLREIERNLHQRAGSIDSVSSFATFATANESRRPSEQHSSPASTDWPMPAPSRSSSRRSTPIPTRHPVQRSDSSSDRADSGVAMSGHRQRKRSATTTNAITARSAGPGGSMDARTAPSPVPVGTLVNPTTAALDALLEANAPPLSSQDEAAILGLVERVRAACQILQGSAGTPSSDVQLVRRQLEEAKNALEGVGTPASMLIGNW